MPAVQLLVRATVTGAHPRHQLGVRQRGGTLAVRRAELVETSPGAVTGAEAARRGVTAIGVEVGTLPPGSATTTATEPRNTTRGRPMRGGSTRPAA
ncbi:hypothetical protein ACR820_17035 [Streptomyces netropsis]